MKLFKKAVAGIMCACMLFSNAGITSLAKEETAGIEGNTEDDELATDSDVQYDATDVTDYELDMNSASDDNTSFEASEEDEVTEPSLNYIVIENDYVETPSTQYVVASIGDEGVDISSATLTYINQTTGATYVKESDKVQDFLILFNLSFDASSLEGQYKLVQLDYIISDKSYSIDFEAIGVEAVFGVDTEVNVNPSGWLIDDNGSSNIEASEDVAGVIVNDLTQSEGVTSDDVAIAIEEIGFDKEDVIWNNSSSGDLLTATPSTYIVVLDPGHGAEDAGATRTYNGVTYYERDLNLKIAQACKTELEKSGVTVYMTRYDNNTKPGLSERAQIAADYGADLFISIHNNSSTGTTAMGSEVWVPNSSSYNYYAYTTGQTLGTDIINQLASLGLNKRGVYTRNATDGDTYPTGDTSDYYTVINESRRRGIPGIIIEHAYVSTQSDAENFLSSDSKLAALGAADAKGILAYINSAPEKGTTIYGGVDYSAVYDYNYYINYADLKKAFGNDKTKAIQHFVNYGMKEGRQASADFNVNYYKNRYADLRKAYGNDLKKYYMHYINYGKKEGRDGKTYCAAPANSTTTTTTTTTGTTVYNGVDYSAVYNYNYYINKYADIKKAFGSNQTAALQHFVNYGMKEGRQGSADFNVNYYKNRYADLRKAYGTDLKKYYLHYMNYGKKEGRDGKTYCAAPAGSTTTTTTTTSTTVYNGVDYSAVYDYNYYINKYADLKKAFGSDQSKALQHFVNYGMKEGRQAKDTFNVNNYKSRYADLQKAFGSDLQKYYLHYINYGQKEGRNCQ